MVKQFSGLTSLLIVLTGLTIGHYLMFERDVQIEQLSRAIGLTGLSSPSLSTTFYEPRLLGEKVIHPAYPQMQNIDRMDFVYAR